MRLEYSQRGEEEEEAAEFRAGDLAAVCHNNHEWLRARVVEVLDVKSSYLFLPAEKPTGLVEADSS